MLDGVLRVGARTGPDPRPILDQAYLIERSHIMTCAPQKGINLICYDCLNGDWRRAKLLNQFVQQELTVHTDAVVIHRLVCSAEGTFGELERQEQGGY